MPIEILYIYSFLVIGLIYFDLTSGVANDAVNFLAPAFGSREKTGKDMMNLILVFAFIGIIIGVLSSNGMMEVARKGVFNPSVITFIEMITLLGVISLVDPFILRTFNNLKLPTSTTVSLVFGLYGAALAVKFIHLDSSSEFINSEEVLTMIIGILLSVIVAFKSGAIIQYISWVLLPYDYQNRSKALIVLFAAFCNTSITYLVLVKGLKNADFLDSFWLIENIKLYLPIAAFAFWSIFFFIFSFILKDILIIVVLCCTLSIGLAFAGNDLVNFIGVGMAAIESISIFAQSSMNNPEAFYMSDLARKVEVNHWYLLIAGLVMGGTLWRSQKARGVLGRSIGLSNSGRSQYDEDSSYISRLLVRKFIRFRSFCIQFIPDSMSQFLEKRLNVAQEKERFYAFDKVRAAVMLSVSSIIISLATSYKLPLSTTYITFMVAMGAAFADRSWGRESAVHRVNGVLSVIIGWFMTAFSASIICFLVTLFFLKTGIGLLIFCMGLYLFWNIYDLFREKSENDTFDDQEEVKSFEDTCISYIRSFDSYFLSVFSCLPVKNKQEVNLEKIIDLKKSIKLQKQQFKNYRDAFLSKRSISHGYEKRRVLADIKDSFVSMHELISLCHKHISESKVFSKEQFGELQTFSQSFHQMIGVYETTFSQSDFRRSKTHDAIINSIQIYEKNDYERSQSEENGFFVYSEVLKETEKVVDFVNRLRKRLKIINDSGSWLSLFVPLLVITSNGTFFVFALQFKKNNYPI